LNPNGENEDTNGAQLYRDAAEPTARKTRRLRVLYAAARAGLIGPVEMSGITAPLETYIRPQNARRAGKPDQLAGHLAKLKDHRRCFY
jgi:hypothetical protein